MQSFSHHKANSTLWHALAGSNECVRNQANICRNQATHVHISYSFNLNER